MERWKVDEKAVRQFLQQRFDITLERTACIDWLHRLGFVRKRPGKRLLKADGEKRAAFVAEYQRLRCEAAVTGAKSKVQAVDASFTRLTCRADEVTRRCRTLLQARADELHNSQQMHHLVPITVSR